MPLIHLMVINKHRNNFTSNFIVISIPLLASTNTKNWPQYQKRVTSPKGNRPLEHKGVDVRIILECILGKQGGKVRTGFIGLGI
jgi:hypothetical protein